MNGPRYRSPELPPPDALREATKLLKEGNDARAKKLAAGARVVLRHNSGLDDLSEAARVELIALCEMARREDEQGGDIEVRLGFYAGLRDAMQEFCVSLGARTSERRQDALEQMREAIASLDRYRGAGR